MFRQGGGKPDIPGAEAVAFGVGGGIREGDRRANGLVGIVETPENQAVCPVLAWIVLIFGHILI